MTDWAEQRLTGWGRYPVHHGPVTAAADAAAAERAVAASALIARGAARAYGDSAAGAGHTLDMTRMNRFLAFDRKAGTVTVEAGVTVGDLIAVSLPRGWFPAAVPGTSHATIGGMIAADAHGKNHRRQGGFGHWVDWIDLVDARGVVRRCGPDHAPALFRDTVGGMGLTGVILRAGLRLIPAETGWMVHETHPADGIGQALDLLDTVTRDRYGVAWIDYLNRRRPGRGLVFAARHACPADLDRRRRRQVFGPPPPATVTVPVDAPGWLLSAPAIRLFNQAYYRVGARRAGGLHLVDHRRFFFPLDAIGGWNRLYGRDGFVQFQGVVPVVRAEPVLAEMIGLVAQSGFGAFLAVLKRLGPGAGSLSFPMEGYTISLDFPNTPKALDLVRALQNRTHDAGGRVYLAKDALMTAGDLRRGYPDLPGFLERRRQDGAAPKFRSRQADRLGL